jgi:tetratricopeptide (TPR) repeat protein
MRRVLVGVALTAVAGCLAPFSWPEDRRVVEAAKVDPIPVTEPVVEKDHLALAAEQLDRGDDAAALPHLKAHVKAHPDAVMIRAYLAELHLKLGNPTASRTEFERVIAAAQGAPPGPARRHLVHCHTRLMEIAQADDDAFAEHLHRGIGLLLLVRQWDYDPERRDDVASEQTLSKAAAALRKARDERPGDARANLYLADVYERLGSPSAARAARRGARAALPDASLTAWEVERIRETE